MPANAAAPEDLDWRDKSADINTFSATGAQPSFDGDGLSRETASMPSGGGLYSTAVDPDADIAIGLDGETGIDPRIDVEVDPTRDVGIDPAVSSELLPGNKNPVASLPNNLPHVRRRFLGLRGPTVGSSIVLLAAILLLLGAMKAIQRRSSIKPGEGEGADRPELPRVADEKKTEEESKRKEDTSTEGDDEDDDESTTPDLPFPPLVSAEDLLDAFSEEFSSKDFDEIYKESKRIDFLRGDKPSLEDFYEFVVHTRTAPELNEYPQNDEERKIRDWTLFRVHMAVVDKTELEVMSRLSSVSMKESKRQQQERQQQGVSIADITRDLLELARLRLAAATDWRQYHASVGIHPKDDAADTVAALLQCLEVHYARVVNRLEGRGPRSTERAQGLKGDPVKLFAAACKKLPGKDTWLAGLIH